MDRRFMRFTDVTGTVVTINMDNVSYYYGTITDGRSVTVFVINANPYTTITCKVSVDDVDKMLGVE